MARPVKNGLEYFPFDVDFFEDGKIEAISGEFGLKGELATIKLLCAVYKNGYFIVWNDLLKMQLLKRLPGVSADLLEQIVNRLVSWGFFDESLFYSAKVLTSNGIQKRYFEATKRRQNSKDLVYVLNNEVNVDINGTIRGVNVYNNPPKESKGNKSKEEITKENLDVSEKEVIKDDVPDFVKQNRISLLLGDIDILKAGPIRTLDDFAVLAKSNQLLIDLVCMENKISEVQYEMAVDKFVRDKKVLNYKISSESDVNQHFIRWVPKIDKSKITPESQQNRTRSYLNGKYANQNN